MADGPAGPGLARGVRLGVDVGSVRVGVACSDPDGLLATPVETVLRSGPEPTGADVVDAGLPGDLARLVEIVGTSGATVVYVGLPKHMSGREGSASAGVRTYCGALARAIAPIQVRLVDERLSTVAAHQALHASGRAGRSHRPVVDQAAAVVILQAALDAERRAGGRVGEAVAPPARDTAAMPEDKADGSAAGRAGRRRTDRMDSTTRGEAGR